MRGATCVRGRPRQERERERERACASEAWWEGLCVGWEGERSSSPHTALRGGARARRRVRSRARAVESVRVCVCDRECERGCVWPPRMRALRVAAKGCACRGCRTPDSGPTPTVGECGAEATLTGPRLAVRGEMRSAVARGRGSRDVLSIVRSVAQWVQSEKAGPRSVAAGARDTELTQRLQDSRDPTSRQWERERIVQRVEWDQKKIERERVDTKVSRATRIPLVTCPRGGAVAKAAPLDLLVEAEPRLHVLRRHLSLANVEERARAPLAIPMLLPAQLAKELLSGVVRSLNLPNSRVVRCKVVRRV